MLLEDLKAKARWLYGSDNAPMVLRAFFSDATLSLFLFRGMSFFNRRTVTKPIAFIFHKINSVLCGCVIGMNATFGRRLIILHSVGITINSAVIAGKSFSVASALMDVCAR